MIKTALRVNINEGETELSAELPGPLFRMRLQMVNNFAARASFRPDVVLNDSGIVIPQNEWFDTGWMNKGPGPLYFMSEEPGAAFRLQVWTGTSAAQLTAAFGYDFDLGSTS